MDYGKTYLLRMVNALMNAELYFAIAEHSLAVVGMDGSYIKPIITDYIMISPGQTMDVLVTANQSLGQYYMAARQYDSVRPDVTDYDKVNVTAILQYKGNYTQESSPIFPDKLPTYENFASAIEFTNQIRSLANEKHPVNIPKNITTRMYITASMNNVEFVNGSSVRTGLGSSLNNVSWVNPSIDVLLAYYRYIRLLTSANNFIFLHIHIFGLRKSTHHKFVRGHKQHKIISLISIIIFI